MTSLPGLLRVEIDGHPIRGYVRSPEVHVRVDGAVACLSRLSFGVSRPARIERRDDALVHVGVDLVRGTGLGHEGGPKPRVRKLRCLLP